MKNMIIAALLTIAATAQAEPITITLIASSGSGAAFTNKVHIPVKYIPDDLNTLADLQGVRPRANIVRRAGALAKSNLDALFKSLPDIYNKRISDAALTNVVLETVGSTSEGDD